MSSTRADGVARLRARALDLPRQLSEGLDAARGSRIDANGPVTGVVVVGMGGSGIAGGFLEVLAAEESEVRVETVRGPSLPRWVGPSSAVVLVSYSGGTWETLAAYEQAGSRGARRFVVASGGELAKRASADEVPIVTVPTGMPPRAAVGYLFGALLGLTDPLFPRPSEERLHRIAPALSAYGDELARPNGPAARLANRIRTGRIEVVSGPFLQPVARRWKNQFEENAKRRANVEVVPEALHNAVVGVDAASRSDLRSSSVVVLGCESDREEIIRGLDYLGSLFVRRGAHRERVDLPGSDRLEILLRGVAFGDHLSLWVAANGGVDAESIDAISTMKRQLGRPKAHR